jgi:hypothetical protein
VIQETAPNAAPKGLSPEVATRVAEGLRKAGLPEE